MGFDKSVRQSASVYFPQGLEILGSVAFVTIAKDFMHDLMSSIPRWQPVFWSVSQFVTQGDEKLPKCFFKKYTIVPDMATQYHAFRQNGLFTFSEWHA